MTTSEAVQDAPPILKLPVELRHIVYSYATDHEPWPALNSNDRPGSRLATFAPRQIAFLTTDRNEMGEPHLICAHQLSQLSKAVRADFYTWLRTASMTMSVVTRVTGLDFQHVSHFLSSLEKHRENAMRVRPDGTSDMRLTIELQGPYTTASMDNLRCWIECVDAFVGSERRAELAAFYKTIDRDGLDHKAVTVIVVRPNQPYDAELDRCIPVSVLNDVREYHDRIAPGGGEVDLAKILAALYCCWRLDWM